LLFLILTWLDMLGFYAAVHRCIHEFRGNDSTSLFYDIYVGFDYFDIKINKI